MKCQKCGKYEANTHITKIANGVKNEIYLCNHCAENANHSPELESIFKSNFDNFFESFWKSPNLGFIQSGSLRVCDNCKSTISDIQNSGKLGCSQCYKTFSDLLLRPLKDIHGNNTHLGKAPKRLYADINKTNKIETLKQELSRAVEEQNFEEAARLRDRIREMEV
ncbi:MAG: UvrB/UvrC motif-containing protein [Clostridia bacterium]|nr:UvrB/UvrC motif-containing protein [Clostridia bacterium]